MYDKVSKEITFLKNLQKKKKGACLWFFSAMVLVLWKFPLVDCTIKSLLVQNKSSFYREMFDKQR